ncbi:MAG: ATP-binding cassette domain-containing protein [Peptostreptococcaceae bacterium]|nr:ATP-binding cassette domain-containing protein [Peptostreptococcaceae bacterium]
MLDVDIQKKLEFFELDIKFTVGNGLLAIQGMSGSGKTTILNCISGIKTADKGHIRLNNRIFFSSNDNINMKIKDRNVGYVFQNYALFPHMTVRENILFGVNKKYTDYEKELSYISDMMKIRHLMDKYPSEISGGEKQRVAFARAMIIRPDILLLDEPFSALDEDLKEDIYKDLLNIKKSQNIPIILITHNKNEAKILADKIIYIHNGKIKA